MTNLQIAGLLVLTAVSAAGMGCAAVLTIRRLTRIGLSLRELKSLAERTPALDSPLTRLTFHESLDPGRFAAAGTESATAGLNALLANGAADGVAVVVNSLRLVQGRAEMIVSASVRGQRLLDEGKAVYQVSGATGARMPTLRWNDSGRYVENLTEARGAMLTARLAAVSTAVIGAAHLVAGADLAKRLGCVESKLDQLLAARRIDQLAKLERIYIAARELASQEMTPQQKLEMWRLRGDLRELRSAWRQEFRLKLDRIEDPANAAFFERLFTFQRSFDGRVSTAISEADAEVGFIEYSVRLEYLLAAVSGTHDQFLRSQESELIQLDQIKQLLEQKAGYISGKYPELSVQPVVEALSNVTFAYRELISSSDGQPALSQVAQLNITSDNSL